MMLKVMITDDDRPETSDRHSHPLTVALLQFAHLRGLLDTEVDLITVLTDHLQLDVLSLVSHGWCCGCWFLGSQLNTG